MKDYHVYNLNFSLMNQQLTTGKAALIFGGLLGAATLVFSLMLYFLDMHYQQSTTQTVVSIVLLVGFTAWGMIAFKNSNDGFISLSEALKVGMGISLISGIIGIATSLLITEVLDPNTMEKAMDLAFEKVRADNPELTEEQLQASREMQERFSTPAIRSTFIIIWSLFIGFIISLITGLIVKKSQPE